jgi:hypothetical protein
MPSENGRAPCRCLARHVREFLCREDQSRSESQNLTVTSIRTIHFRKCVVPRGKIEVRRAHATHEQGDGVCTTTRSTSASPTHAAASVAQLSSSLPPATPPRRSAATAASPGVHRASL